VAEVVRAYNEIRRRRSTSRVATTDVCVHCHNTLEYQGRSACRFYASIRARVQISPRADAGEWELAFGAYMRPPPTASATGAGLLVLTLTRTDQRHDPLRQQTCYHRSACRAPSPDDNMTYLDQPWFNRKIITRSQWRTGAVHSETRPSSKAQGKKKQPQKIPSPLSKSNVRELLV